LRGWLNAGCRKLTGIYAPLREYQDSYSDPDGQQIETCSKPSIMSTSLTRLDLSECAQLDDSGVSVIASQCRTLQHIFLRRCCLVGDVGVQFLATYCTRLESVSLCECLRVSEKSLVPLFAALRGNLRYLSLVKCVWVRDASLKALARDCRKLGYLNVRGCAALSDHSLHRVFECCARLHSVDVGRCRVTDTSLITLAQHGRCLQKLGLRGCARVTDEGLRWVAEGCARLSFVNMQECPQVTLSAIRQLRLHRPECVVEHNILAL